ncbi:MAG TPA: hypothetical protein VGB20_05515 [bacterium]
MTAVGRLERAADRLLERLALRPWRMALPVVSLAFLGILTRIVIADPDLFARIALGRLIWASGAIPHADPFSYTTTRAWIDHEWGAGVVFYAISRLGGDLPLFLWACATAAAAIALAHAAQRALTRHARAALAWLCLGLAPCLIVWMPVARSRIFTFLCFSVFLLACARLRARGRTRLLWILPGIMLFWANAHAGFVAGLGTLAILTVALLLEGRRKAGLAAGAALLGCLVATLVNPYGPAFWTYVLEAVTMSRIRVTEWHPTNLLSADGLYLVFVAGVLLAGLARDRRSIPLEGKLLLAIVFIQAVRHFRLVPLFHWLAIVYGTNAFAAVLAPLQRRWPHRFRIWRRALAMALAGAALAGAVSVGAALARGGGYRLRYSHLPVGAMAWLVAHRDGGRLLVHFNEGSYALWRGYPDFTVSLDARYDAVYPEETVARVAEAFYRSTPDLPAVIEEIGADYILICPGLSEHVATAAQYGPRWRVIYADARCQILSQTPNPDGRLGRPSETWPDIWTPNF